MNIEDGIQPSTVHGIVHLRGQGYVSGDCTKSYARRVKAEDQLSRPEQDGGGAGTMGNTPASMPQTVLTGRAGTSLRLRGALPAYLVAAFKKGSDSAGGSTAPVRILLNGTTRP